MQIGSNTKIEVGLLAAILGGLVWILTHILPTEARVDEHEKKIYTLEQKVDVIVENTNYIKGKLDRKGDR